MLMFTNGSKLRTVTKIVTTVGGKRAKPASHKKWKQEGPFILRKPALYQSELAQLRYRDWCNAQSGSDRRARKGLAGFASE